MQKGKIKQPYRRPRFGDSRDVDGGSVKVVSHIGAADHEDGVPTWHRYDVETPSGTFRYGCHVPLLRVYTHHRTGPFAGDDDGGAE